MLERLDIIEGKLLNDEDLLEHAEFLIYKELFPNEDLQEKQLARLSGIDELIDFITSTLKTNEKSNVKKIVLMCENVS